MDLLRAGINGRVAVGERAPLPRAGEVAGAALDMEACAWLSSRQHVPSTLGAVELDTLLRSVLRLVGSMPGQHTYVVQEQFISSAAYQVRDAN
eukprot:406790-Amphidinium_carterae.1